MSTIRKKIQKKIKKKNAPMNILAVHSLRPSSTRNKQISRGIGQKVEIITEGETTLNELSIRKSNITLVHQHPETILGKLGFVEVIDCFSGL